MELGGEDTSLALSWHIRTYFLGIRGALVQALRSLASAVALLQHEKVAYDQVAYMWCWKTWTLFSNENKGLFFFGFGFWGFFFFPPK